MQGSRYVPATDFSHILYGVTHSALALCPGRSPVVVKRGMQRCQHPTPSTFRSLGARELKDLESSLVISDWPGLGHVITRDPIAVAETVRHRLTCVRVGARVDPPGPRG